MYPKKKTPAERGQMIFMIVCLSFVGDSRRSGGCQFGRTQWRRNAGAVFAGAFDGRRRFLFLVYLLEIHEV